MEYKPTITYSFSKTGDESLFLTLSTHLRKVLQLQSVRWKRSYGRTPHELALDVKFLPLTPALLKRNDLVTRPYFHVFWTDCCEMDFYRSHVKNEIASWLSDLVGNDACDWLIVVVTGDGISKTSKPKLTLPRTSLADKIKTDFCSKFPDRIQTLQDPMKESTKTNESWASLAVKLANFTVLSLENAVTKYEDRVRAERERRNEKSWNFCNYFVMQEELAFMFEMLSLHEEALIQYNELDAMFTQYLLNAHAGDVAHWLSSFTKPIAKWRSLSLWRRIDGDARQMLIEDTASLIDVRNYLFARHCHLLFVVGDMKRITELMHTFLHATTLELDILEIQLPPGARECWVFMSCIELGHSIERIRDQRTTKYGGDDNSEVFMKMTRNDIQLEIANLWNLARSKLLSLGKLCGLMPNVETSSENLQTVVDLIAGMGEEEERDGLAKPPSLVLREALSSKENFRAQCLELSELAMGTFKHTGRHRSAKKIGRDLADFYMCSDEPAKAESFYLNSVRMFTNEGWPHLMADASQKLAECYKRLYNVRRYVRMCCALMCNQYISKEKRSFYCDELRSLSTDFGDQNLPILLAVFATVKSVQFVPAQTSFRHKTSQHILLHVYSKAPKPMRFHFLQLSLRHRDTSADDSMDKSAMSETLDEEQELDVLSFTTFSSDDENESEPSASSSDKQSLASSIKTQSSAKSHARKRRRYVSSSSYDSIFTITQTPLDSDGRIQLIQMEEPFSQPSKCISNRLPSMIQIAYEYETKEDDILWAGITCRSARQLLRRQDSYQSLCSIHSSTTSVVMETYSDNLLVKNVTINPGDNVVEVPIDTLKAGNYTLRQLRFSINKIHFVLPRILPVISYTVTKDKPILTVEHEPRLYCNIEQIIHVKISSRDYELDQSPDNRLLILNTPKHLQIRSIKVVHAETGDGAKIEFLTCVSKVEECKCSLELPRVPVHSTIAIEIHCICSQPVAHGIGHKHHRRTHSAPPTTIHRHVQTSYPNSIHIDPNGKLRTQTNNDMKLPKSLFARRNSESPVKKFLSFVKEVKDRVEIKKSDKLDEADIQIYANDDFLEVTLEEPGDGDMQNHDIAKKRETRSKSVSINGSLSERSSTHDTISMNSLSSNKSLPITHQKSIVPPQITIQQRHTLAVHKEITLEDDKRVICNISFLLPWDDLPPTSTSLKFLKLLEFSHKVLRSPCSLKRVPNFGSSCLRQVVSISIENSSPRPLALKNFKLKIHGLNVNIKEISQKGLQNFLPSQSITSAWNVEFLSSAPQECGAQFEVDVLSAEGTESSSVIPVVYKFDLESTQTLYIVSSEIGAPGEELVIGQMTNLKISVERIRRDPEHEHTRGGQQLLMYQVIDTRGRWAVCGKSTGVISVPISSMGASDLGPPVTTAELEIMPLIDGFLHRPVVVLQRYLKRRSGEFDEHLSSTESPVLKPPRLMDFRLGEVVNIDEYQQVKVMSTPAKERTQNAGENLVEKTKL